MSDERPSLDAPGLSVSALIDLVDTRNLPTLVGPGVLEVLGRLDPTLTEPETVRRLAKRLIDPPSAVRDPAQLKHLVALLPLQKARELARKLRVSDDRHIFDALQRAASDLANAAAFRSFFGIVEDRKAIEEARAALLPGHAEYALFDHQRKAARRVHSVLQVAPRKTVLHMPTGSGKTRTAMHVVSAHLNAAEPTLVCWLAASQELLEQASDEFAKAWRRLGNREVAIYRLWGDFNPDLTEARDGIVVAGLGKMHALSSIDPMTVLRLGDRASLVVMDEAHQAIAPTYRALISSLYKKRPQNALLGLTATPGRTWSDIPQDAELAAFFDNAKVVLDIDGYENPVDYLMAEGYLAKPTFRTLEIGQGLPLSSAETTAIAGGTDVPDGILEKLGDDAQRNVQIISAIEDLLLRHRRIIVFAASVAHARLLSAVLVARGHDADVVTGETDAGQRERIIRRFRGAAPEPMVLCNFGVLTTGFDAPATSAAVIARPTKSLVLYSQMVGRATRGRRAGGNDTAEILTVVDPGLPGFGSIAEAFMNWEDVWHEP